MFVRARTAALGTLCTPYLRGFKPQEGGNDDLVPLAGTDLNRPNACLDNRERAFISALPPCAFVVNMSRTTKKPNSEESNATKKIDLSDLRLGLRTAIHVHSVRLPARAFRH
jgi:hypothetical protein